jgi:hypothetical protein
MNGRLRNRYEVGHYRGGLISTHATRQEAFQAAVDWCERPTGYDNAEAEVSVYDSMARRDQPTKWKRNGGRWIVVGLRIA